MITFLKAEEQHQHKNGGGWVANTATVDASAYIGPNAQVYGKALVSDNARVFGDAQVSGDAWVFGKAWVFDNARVFGDAWVSGYAQVSGNAQVSGYAQVSGDAWETSPLYIQGTRHAITNCAYGLLAIGCQVHTFAEWKKNYKAIGKEAGYTEEQIKEYGRHILYATEVGK